MFMFSLNSCHVLIETLWNVNKRQTTEDIIASIIVLIETLWNVNAVFIAALMFRVVSINRNIVECKSVSHKDIPYMILVLIETLWNVNTLSEIGTDREVQY